MKPAINIIGITHQTNTPPAKTTSTIFMATSIDIMDIKDIPVAVLNASLIFICLERIMVSKMIDVISPLIIAKVIIPSIGKGISLIWKKRMVPKSPIEHPNKHQSVFIEDLLQV